MKLNLKEVENLLKGCSDIENAESTTINSVKIDSRLVKSGDIFFCIEGENFDGHNFAEAALNAGAAAIVTSCFMPELGEQPVIVVKDTIVALGKLANYYKSKSNSRLIAVTGSAGKTSVKEMMAQVLGENHKVHKNFLNLNNQIGLPLSILESSGDETFLVMELGISNTGDMAELGVIATPDLAMVHNIGPAHIEGLGSLENIAKEKASIFKYLNEHGTAICSADYPLLKEAALEICTPLFFSSKDENCEYFCKLLSAMPDGRGKYLIKAGNKTAETTLPSCGEHFAENGAAVTCAASALGMDLEEIADALSKTAMPKQRFACHTFEEWTLIDDSYNANPLSMHKAIDTAKKIAGERPLVLVLGDMLELGNKAVEEHNNLGKKIAQIKPETTFYFGSHYVDVAEFTNGSTLVPVKSPQDFMNGVEALGLHDAVVLFKGSRSCKMENYFNALSKKLNKSEDN